MIEFMSEPEPIEQTFRLYFPPDRPGVARLHSTHPNCTAGAAGGRWRSEHWSRRTWDTTDGALNWAHERHYTVERSDCCFT